MVGLRKVVAQRVLDLLNKWLMSKARSAYNIKWLTIKVIEEMHYNKLGKIYILFGKIESLRIGCKLRLNYTI